MRFRCPPSFAQRLPCLALLALLATGCSNVLPPALGNDQHEEEVAALKRQIVELQRQATMSKVEVDRLRQEVRRLEGDLATRAPAPPVMEMARTPELGSTEPGSPPPAAVADIDAGIEEGELEEIEPPRRESLDPAATVAPVASAPQPVSSEGQNLYDNGYTLFHQERYREAEESFRSFLELHPASDLSDNAQFWIGECRYAQGEFSRALAAFSATVERYPSGNKVPDALLKAGKCLEALGDLEAARETYGEIRDRFPSSAAAALARDRLGALP